MLTNCGNSNNQKEIINEELKIESSQETVQINGVNHFIKKIGNGEPLLVLHGGPGSFHDYLIPHFKRLAKTYQIIFYDQRGCGKTEFPQDTMSIKLENYIEDLEGIRNHLKIDKLNLVGHSWGALLAMNYGKKYTENLKRLILISPAPANSDYFDQTFINMQKKRSEEDTKELVETMMSSEFEKRETNTFKKAILLLNKVNLVDQETISKLYDSVNFNINSANNLMLVNSLLERTYINFNTIEGLKSIQCPTLIIVGDMDNVPFNSIQLIQENITGSKLEVIRKSCHYPFFESPKVFYSKIKNFLDPEYEE